MKICIVVGARPNFMKVAPLIHAIDKARREGNDIDHKLVYAGSANDPTIEDGLFGDLRIDKPNVYLGVDCENLNELTGKVMSEFDKYLTENQTDTVIVVDDLASTMAAAIVTKKHGIALAHLVAGTRSFNINMPKEINRLVIDGLSDLLFTAGISSSSTANKEGAKLANVYEVGNILMDTLRFNHSRLKRPQILDDMTAEDGKYIVFTLNRKALIAQRENLRDMLGSMSKAAGGVPIIATLRDRARMVVSDLSEGLDNIQVTGSLPYLEFGYLTAHAMGIVTDSGNVAEEATFNSVPCITLNSYTEHVETVKQGSNILVGEDPEKLGKAIADMVNHNWKSCTLPDKWDGRTAERIVHILLEMHKQ